MAIKLSAAPGALSIMKAILDWAVSAGSTSSAWAAASPWQLLLSVRQLGIGLVIDLSGALQPVAWSKPMSLGYVNGRFCSI